jgi:hypothetical protein
MSEKNKNNTFSTTEEFMDPDYPRQETSIAWARAAGFELLERHGNMWLIWPP